MTNIFPGHASLEDIPFVLRLKCLSLVNIPDLGRFGKVSKQCALDASHEFVWRNQYQYSFAEDSTTVGSPSVNAFVNRPSKHDCIGWKVAVQVCAGQSWELGTVVDFRNDFFLVCDDKSGKETWQRETFPHGAWHLCGKMRIKFVSPPKSCSLLTCTNNFGSSDQRHEVKRLKSVPSWRGEAKKDRTRAPIKLIGSICRHEDEVLSVAFSNKGDLLASSSRDGTTRIFKLYFDNDGERNILSFSEVFVIQHETTDVPCRVVWSPDDCFVLVCTEAKYGNLWDFDASVACYCVTTGRRILSKVSIPFDVCAEWVGNRVFVSGQNLTISNRGVFHQVLGLWDVGGGVCVGRIFFNFSGESFVHLIKASACGKFLLVSMGMGDSLSDSVRIIGIPSEVVGKEEDDEFEKIPFSLRVPRSKLAEKFDSEISRFNEKKIGLEDFQPQANIDEDFPTFYCRGAIVGLEWSKVKPGIFYANVRPYVSSCQSSPSSPSSSPSSPSTTTPGSGNQKLEISGQLELQVWDCHKPEPLQRIKGAHGFTDKSCPFYLFIAESPCGDYVASGSEDCGVYIYNIRHGALLRVLWNGHNDVISSVAWSTMFEPIGCLLASASDDRKICLWSDNQINSIFFIQ